MTRFRTESPRCRTALKKHYHISVEMRVCQNHCLVYGCLRSFACHLQRMFEYIPSYMRNPYPWIATAKKLSLTALRHGQEGWLAMWLVAGLCQSEKTCCFRQGD